MDLFSSSLAQVLLPSGVLISSLLGSVHCVGMCGGLVSLVVKTRSDWFQYHLARGLLYVCAGAASGALGQSVFGWGEILTENPEAAPKTLWILWMSGLQGLAIGLVGVSFLFLGLRLIRGRSLHFGHVAGVRGGWLRHSWVRLHHFHQRGLQFLSRRGPLGMGLATVFLPCGWLYGYVLAAATTGSAITGMVWMFLFWLGTIPALSIGVVLLQKSIGLLNRRTQRIAGLILVIVTLWILGARAHSIYHRHHSRSDPGEPSAICH